MSYRVRRVYTSPAPSPPPRRAPRAAEPAPPPEPRYRVHIRFPGACDPLQAGLEGVGVVRFALANATGRAVERVEAEPVRLVVPVTGREEVEDVVMQVLLQRGALSRTEVLFEDEDGPHPLHPVPRPAPADR